MGELIVSEPGREIGTGNGLRSLPDLEAFVCFIATDRLYGTDQGLYRHWDGT